MARGHATDLEALRREFAGLPFAQRRAVTRAVSRGVVVDDRKLTPYAVVLARRQQRLWRWVWLTGPAIGLTQLGVGLEAAIAAMVVATVTMGTLARWWYTRAQRAEVRNLEQVPKRHRKRLERPET